MSFIFLSIMALAIAVGALVLLTSLIVNPHVDELIQDHWSPEECNAPCQVAKKIKAAAQSVRSGLMRRA